MDERVQFVADFLSDGYTMSELCRRYGVSRPTGYALVERYERAHGPAGLLPQSRRPHSSPHATPATEASAIVTCRQRHPDWGPRKILDHLRLRAPDRPWPAPSTAGEILKRHGLVTARRQRRPVPPALRAALSAMREPNDVWTIDFKGQFRTRDGVWCYPLTVMDGASRYLLACVGLDGTRMTPTRVVLDRLFREYGLPRRIRSDNGVPFPGPTALARLSVLSGSWIRLGIMPELVQPGCPAQNGRHERMHRTLKARTARPPAANRAAQQRRFASFRTEYNDERPHAALGGVPPAMCYVSSSRPYPRQLEAVDYPRHYERRRVSGHGSIKWRDRSIWVSEVLAGESVGCEEIGDAEWAVPFGPVRIGTLDERRGRIQPVGQDHDGRDPYASGSR
jgi:transposase InsO family protein